MRFSALETGSCLRDEKRFSLAVHKSHPAVKTEEKYNFLFLFYQRGGRSFVRI